MGMRSTLRLACLASALAALAVAGAGCGGGGGAGAAESSPTASADTTPTRTPPPAPWPCKSVKQAARHSASYPAPRQIVSRGETLTAVVRTNCGSFSIALDAKRFPNAVNSFVFLARKGFYDGMPFDKAAAGRYLHGGDPPGPASGPGYSVTGQIPSGFIYRHGVVAMAEPKIDEAKAPRAGSQFFVVLARPWLDFTAVYPPFGTVKSGFDVLNGISHFGPRSRYRPNPGVLGPSGKLRRPVVIEGITIEKGKG